MELMQSATLSVAGSVTIQCALLSVTLFVSVQSVRCNANSHPVPTVLFIVRDLPAPFAVPRICVKKMIVLSARLSAVLQSVIANALLPSLSVLPCVKKRSVIGNARNPRFAQSRSVNCSVRDQLVMRTPRFRRLSLQQAMEESVVLAQRKTLAQLLIALTL